MSADWWIATAGLAFVWCMFGLALYARRRMRGDDRLDYGWPMELDWFTDSLETWQLRCAASLRASRERRGIDPTIDASNQDR